MPKKSPPKVKVQTSFDKGLQRVNRLLKTLETLTGVQFDRKEVKGILALYFLRMSSPRKEIERELKDLQRKERKIKALEIEKLSVFERQVLQEMRIFAHAAILERRNPRKHPQKRCAIYSDAVTDLMHYFWQHEPLQKYMSFYPGRLTPMHLYEYVGKIIECVTTPCPVCGNHHRFKDKRAVYAVDRLAGNWEVRGKKMRQEIERSWQKLASMPFVRGFDSPQ